MKRIISLSFALLAVYSATTPAATLLVPADYTTIQAAINAAFDGDEVVVADGTYTGLGNRDIDFLGKAITVKSENGPENCIIDCNGTKYNLHRGFYFHNGEGADSVLTGFTITNGYESKAGAIYCTQQSSPTIVNCIMYNNEACSSQGGAIRCEVESNPNIKDCLIRENIADRGGGGIYCNNSSPVIEDCNITRNTACCLSGGGIYCDDYSCPMIKNCTISYNKSCEPGGGIYCNEHSCPTIIDCNIIRNRADDNDDGGGIYCDDYSSPAITNCNISGNIVAGGDGGGIYCYYRSSPAITNCTINENKAYGGNGGAIFCSEDCEPIITNCVISGNITTKWSGGGNGAGIYCNDDSNAKITNCTFSKNSAEIAGGGMYSYQSNPLLTNCIFWENTDSSGMDESAQIHTSSSFPVINYSCIQGWSGILGGTDNFGDDPLLQPDGYHLQLGSLCIDTGDPSGDYAGQTDIDGWPRIIGTRVDIGADEFTLTVVGFEITGPAEVTENASEQYNAIASYNDGSIKDVTASTIWSLQPQTYAAIYADGVLITQHIDTHPDSITIYAEFTEYGVTTHANITVNISLLTDIEIIGPQQTWETRQPQYELIAHYDNGSTNNVTALALWNAEPQMVATIDSGGLLYPEDIDIPENITIFAQYSALGITLESQMAVQVLPSQTLNVPADYDTIQAAVNVAEDHDLILVADGIYTGNGNRDIDSLGKAVILKSENGPENCIIDCQATETKKHRGFYFHNNEDADSVLDGFTITNGYASRGGGIYCDPYSRLTINNCTISGNTAENGGGLHGGRYTTISISNCTISGNSAEYDGGGIYRCSDTVISNCTISGNSAGHGGGLSDCHNTIISNCTISGNSAEYDGGGIYRCSGVISNCIISGNSAEYDGGGIYRCSGVISNCIISGNSAEYDGGGISECRDIVISNCIISGNSAQDRGGGISWCDDSIITSCVISGNSAGYDGGAISPCYNTVLNNCAIIGNKAKYDSGGICDFSGPITNCIIWNNITYPDDIPWLFPQIKRSWIPTYCCFNYAHGDSYGNIDKDPCFVQPGFWDTNSTPDNAVDDLWVEGDYHLLPDSLCINTADPLYPYDHNETDLDGNPRIIAGRIDMGAYEFNPDASSIVLSPADFLYIKAQSNPQPQTLRIKNCGGGTLNWQIIEDCDWLEAVPASGASSISEVNEVTLTVGSEALLPGCYSCIVNVVDPNAVNSPQSVNVVFNVFQEVIYVPDEADNIQHAIDYVLDGGMVIIADGTYSGTGNRDIDFRGKAITVKSQNGPQNCIIDCNGTENYPRRGFYFHNAEGANSVLDGLTIINGYPPKPGSGNPFGGAGIACYNASPTIKNCYLSGNYAHAISCDGASPKIENCIITENTSSVGGGIGCHHDACPLITRCTIIRNTVSYDGGGIFCSGSSPVINDCNISENSADGSGGAVYCRYGSSPTIINSTITGNSACNGGAIYCSNSTTTIANSVLSGNSADEYGGGFYYSGSSASITNCTFVGNSSPYGNAVACVFSPSNLKINNCIFWDGGDEIYNYNNSTIDITYSDIQGGWLGIGNINIDPCFVDPCSSNYHLLPDSFCINTGDPNYIAGPNETDLGGLPRVFGGRIDMGAYETNYIQARLWLFPKTINRHSRTKRIMAWIHFPRDITKDQIDNDQPVLLYYPGAAEPIEPIRQYVFQYGRGSHKRTYVLAYYDKAELMAAVPSNGPVDLEVIGKLKSRQYFYGSDTVRIIGPRWRRWFRR